MRIDLVRIDLVRIDLVRIDFVRVDVVKGSRIAYAACNMSVKCEGV